MTSSPSVWPAASCDSTRSCLARIGSGRKRRFYRSKGMLQPQSRRIALAEPPGRSCRQRFAEEPQPVAVHDPVQVRLAVALLAQMGFQLMQIVDRVQRIRRLLAIEAPVQIAADARVFRRAGE